jgi:6-phosphogluconolactonase
VYVGTYTTSGSQGIYVAELDRATGKLTNLHVAARTLNPSFLAIHPSSQRLYAVNEVQDVGAAPGQRGTGSVTGFRIDPMTGALSVINSQPTGGAGPCHVCVDRSGRNVLAANYGGGSIVCFPLNDDGSLRAASAFVQHQGHSINPKRQAGPHAHSVNVSPDNRFVFAADLGLDRILIYQFDAATGALAPHDPPFVAATPGGGPRHFAFHPGGHFAFHNNELDWTITAHRYDGQRGALTPLETRTTIPVDYSGSGGTAEVLVHPTGRAVYVSNRGPDSLAVFQIHEDGTLSPATFVSTQGKTPRNFSIDPTGKWLLAANQDSNTIATFHIDPATGALTPTGEVCSVPTPVCVTFLQLP